MSENKKRPKVTGNSSLHEAVSDNNLSKVISLLKSGVDVNAQNSEGETPLHFVNDYAITKELLAAGADLHVRSQSGDTPLISGIVSRTVPVVSLLLQAGANAQDRIEVSYYVTPLHLSVTGWIGGVHAIVKLLLEAGADVNALDHNDKTPLHIMLQHHQDTNRENSRIIKLLLDAGADLSLKDDEGAAPLDYAKTLDPYLCNYIKKMF